MPVGSAAASVQDAHSVTDVRSAGYWHSFLKRERKQRRPGPAHPHYGIPPEQWPDVQNRVEQGEPLRQIARDYGVAYETVRRTLKAAHKRERGGK
jgi:DNA invertase Pin-like site-specific DNA recombinase